MARITKAPEERRLEIIETAERLFHEVGYAKCSIEMIIREIGVAKGTFYYYFKSKEGILGAIVERTVAEIEEMANAIADDPERDALAKMKLLLSGLQVSDRDAREGGAREVTEILHLPENRELHEATSVATVLSLSPVLARIVEQGNREGVFNVARPLETVQIILTGAHFLLDGGLFDLTEDEKNERRAATRDILEKSLGAAPGAFAFMTPDSPKGV